MNDIIKREIAEVVAPVTWLLSPRRLFREVLNLFFFAVFAFAVFQVVTWMLVGVYGGWSLLWFVVSVAFTVITFLWWIARGPAGQEYHEH